MTETTDRAAADPREHADPLGDLDYGVPWALEDHHHAWQQTMRDFCVREVAPGAAERSIAGVFDADLARAAGRLGAYGLLAEERHGGGGADLRTLCLTA
jgi:short-chain 2-methylacyl-CoA dehydrogenase